MRVGIYARYSSDLQSASSIEDQVRLCSERAEKEGWQVINCFSDAGVSGASLLRPGIQGLMAAAMNGEMDIVLCEAMDRLSRDQEDIAGLFKRMSFAGVRIITLSEGEINTMHIGLKGTMNAMFLKDLADKTRRGLRGKVEKGKSGGGIAYGYKVLKQFDAHGEPIKGGREINPVQAAIIHRIFKEYANDNKSPKAIAAQLNVEGIPCPSGKAWGQSTINGNRKRGTGILNNELYIGRLIWNRQRMIKDPSTGKRVTRMNDKSEWVIQEVPELRIVDQDLWEAAKARQQLLDKAKPTLHKTNRPQYLLSGLLKCGECGGGYAKINSHYYGCSAAKNKGAAVCTNKRVIKRETLESLVLQGLQNQLMREDMMQIFCEEYTKRMNEHLKLKKAHVTHYRSELTQCRKERENLVQALKDGVHASLVKDDLERVTRRIKEVEIMIEEADQTHKPLLHPSMAGQYRREVMALKDTLNKEEHRSAAAQHLRTLVEKVVLTLKKDQDGLQVDLHGDLAGIMQIALKERKEDIDNNFLLDQLGCMTLHASKTEPVDRIGSGGWI